MPATLLLKIPMSYLESLDGVADPRAKEFEIFGRAVWKAYQKSKDKIGICIRHGCSRSFVKQHANSDQSFCSRTCGNVERAREKAIEKAQRAHAMYVLTHDLKEDENG